VWSRTSLVVQGQSDQESLVLVLRSLLSSDYCSSVLKKQLAAVHRSDVGKSVGHEISQRQTQNECPGIRSLNALTGTLKPQSNGPWYYIWWLVHWPMMDGLLHLVQRGGGGWVGCGPAQSHHRCTKCNTAHPSTASVPTSYYSMRHHSCLCTVMVNTVCGEAESESQ